MAGIAVKAYGVEAVQTRLRELSSRMSNMRPAMKAIGERIVEQTERRFEAGGPAPDGSAWKTPKTPNPKRVRTLTVSGHLRDSIRFQLLGSNGVAIGSNKEYAAIHQLGGKIVQGARSELFIRNRYKTDTKTGKRKGQFKKGIVMGRGYTFGQREAYIPARPFLGLSRANSDEIMGIINDYVTARQP